jgi:tetratricopeptide (TPR) repeat protein
MTACAENGGRSAERVYQRIPEHRRRPFVLQHLGMMYLEQGQHQKALPYLEAAAKKQSDNHNIHYALGCAQEATGQLKSAHASYKRAVNCRKAKYNLEFKEAQDALKRATEKLATAPPPEVQDTPEVQGAPKVQETPKDNKGVIESYNEARGFGFISSKTQPRVFFHVSSVAGRQKLSTYLNRHWPTFYTASCASFEGCNYFDPVNPRLVPFRTDRIETVDWLAAGVDIEAEFDHPSPGRHDIHQYLRNRLADSEAQVIFYDHGTGELADFLTLAMRVDDVLATLFHCKASSALNPGERVGDLYEVCGQAVKSARWVDRKLMLARIEKRVARGSVFVRGTPGTGASLPFRRPAAKPANHARRAGALEGSLDHCRS